MIVFVSVSPFKQGDWSLLFSFHGHNSLEQAKDCFDFEFIDAFPASSKQIPYSLTNFDECTSKLYQDMKHLSTDWSYRFISVVT